MYILVQVCSVLIKYLNNDFFCLQQTASKKTLEYDYVDVNDLEHEYVDVNDMKGNLQRQIVKVSI